MSEAAEKLHLVVPEPGRARRTLGSLRSGLGRLEIVEGDEAFPVRLVRTSMSRRSSWVHLSGRGPMSLYECEEREW